MIAGKLDRRLLIEEKTVTRDPGYNSEVITWVPVATVWASVRDELSGSQEGTTNDVRVLTRPCRVWIRWRADVCTTMRATLLGDSERVMQIVGMAEIGRREGLELRCEAYST